jgi:hypothetical protein
MTTEPLMPRLVAALRNIAAVGHARDNVQRANDKLDQCIEWTNEVLAEADAALPVAQGQGDDIEKAWDEFVATLPEAVRNNITEVEVAGSRSFTHEAFNFAFEYKK